MGCSLGKGGRLSGNRGLSAPPTHLYDYDDPIPSNATLRLCPRLASRARGRGHPARGFDPQVISLPGSAAVARMIGGPAEVVAGYCNTGSSVSWSGRPAPGRAARRPFPGGVLVLARRAERRRAQVDRVGRDELFPAREAGFHAAAVHLQLELEPARLADPRAVVPDGSARRAYCTLHH